MERIRAPFLVLAVILMIAAVLTEIGGTALVNATPIGAFLRSLPTAPTISADDLLQNSALVGDAVNSVDRAKIERAYDKPPGFGVPYMVVLDAIFAFTLASMASGLFIPQSVQATGQGVVTCLVALTALIGGVVMIFAALLELMTMIALLLAIPFGTIVYLIVYGSFDTTTSNAILAVVMSLKVLAIICVLLAHQAFIQRIGLLLLVLSSLVINVLVTFLLSFPPGFLVSITDAVAGIVVALCGVVWSIPLLIAAILAIVKVLGLLRRAGSVV